MPTMRARSGMVCTVDHLASVAGVGALRSGGSAADAAVAASAVLAVTTQHMCGMGGDLFALVHTGSGPPECLNASGRAGSGASAQRLRDEGHTVMPFRGDIRSVPVPGCVDGWLALHGRHGRLPLPEVLGAAIELAEHGFPASPFLERGAELVADVVGAEDYAHRLPMRAGDLVRRPGAARALRAIAAEGRAGFYEGEFGEGLLEVGAGEYVPADMKSPLATWTEPLGIDVWGHRVWTVPPNSQGYLSLAAAGIAAGLDLPDDPTDDLWVHLLVESARHAAYDRTAVLAESADGHELIAPDRLAARRAMIDPGRAAHLGDTYADGGTIYLCAVDGDRMGVSLIQSNAAGFGSHLAVPAVGIFLHNRGIGFSLESGHPAEYAPGRRPPSTLAPALITHPDGSLRTVLGTMGGDAQPQIVLQLLDRLLRLEQSPGAVIDGPRWMLSSKDTTGFDTWRHPDDNEVLYEEAAPATWDGLVGRGHDARRAAGNYGHAHLIDVVPGPEDATSAANPARSNLAGSHPAGSHPAGSHLAGAADPRALIGAAIGF